MSQQYIHPSTNELRDGEVPVYYIELVNIIYNAIIANKISSGLDYYDITDNELAKLLVINRNEITTAVNQLLEWEILSCQRGTSSSALKKAKPSRYSMPSCSGIVNKIKLDIARAELKASKEIK